MVLQEYFDKHSKIFVQRTLKHYRITSFGGSMGIYKGNRMLNIFLKELWEELQEYSEISRELKRNECEKNSQPNVKYNLKFLGRVSGEWGIPKRTRTQSQLLSITVAVILTSQCGSRDRRYFVQQLQFWYALLNNSSLIVLLLSQFESIDSPT